MFDFKIEGMYELLKNLGSLGEVPQKHVTASVRKGMNIVLRQARATAPRDTGDLKRGIVSVGEVASNKGKKVYRIVFDRGMNDVFQKPVKSVGMSGSPKAKDPAYYPISQEYGYFAKNGRYIPGFRFGRNAFKSKLPDAKKAIIETMKKKTDEEISKRGLK